MLDGTKQLSIFIRVLCFIVLYVGMHAQCHHHQGQSIYNAVAAAAGLSQHACHVNKIDQSHQEATFFWRVTSSVVTRPEGETNTIFISRVRVITTNSFSH